MCFQECALLSERHMPGVSVALHRFLGWLSLSFSFLTLRWSQSRRAVPVFSSSRSDNTWFQTLKHRPEISDPPAEDTLVFALTEDFFVLTSKHKCGSADLSTVLFWVFFLWSCRCQPPIRPSAWPPQFRLGWLSLRLPPLFRCVCCLKLF